MKIVSFNINSIRARPHQLIHLRDTIDPDVIGIQETKNDERDSEIDIDNDYLLNEGAQILSDYTILNQNIYLSKAA